MHGNKRSACSLGKGVVRNGKKAGEERTSGYSCWSPNKTEIGDNCTQEPLFP